MNPPFDGIGARRSRSYMLARISAEREAVDLYSKLNPQGELFAHARVPLTQARSLVSYLLTLPDPVGGFQIAGHKIDSETVASGATAQSTANEVNSDLLTKPVKEGKSLFLRRNCLSCHSVGNGGGQFAPSLDGIGRRRSRAYIVGTLTAAEVHILTESDKSSNSIVMSPSAFSASEIQSVTDFLMSLPDSSAIHGKGQAHGLSE